MLKHTKFAAGISNFIGKLFAWLPIHPNSITILSVIMALLGYITWLPGLEYKFESIMLFAFAFFFDAIDGAIARAKKLESKEGAFLDGIADRVVEFFLILALFKIYAFNIEITIMLFFIMFFGTGMTSFVKAYAEHSGVISHARAITMPGWLERPERSLLLLAVYGTVIMGYTSVASGLVYITAGLTVLTFLQRMIMVILNR